MRKTLNKNILVLLCFLFPLVSFSQEDCSKRLRNAIELYEKGLYEQSIKILGHDIKSCKYQAEQRQVALKTMISCYHELDSVNEYNNYTYRFLRENPKYIPFSTDPMPFRNAIEKYSVYPRFSISANFGINFLIPEITEVDPVWETGSYSSTYKITSQICQMVNINWYITKNLSLSTGSYFQQYKYTRIITALDEFKINYSESFSYFSIPVLIHFSVFNDKKLFPSFFTGVYATRLLTAKGNISVSDIFDQEELGFVSYFNDSKKNIQMKDYRTSYNFGYKAGIAINYNLKNWMLSFETAYNLEFYDYTNTEKYNENMLYSDFYYIDDIIKNRILEFGVSVTRYISYKIKPVY